MSVKIPTRQTTQVTRPTSATSEHPADSLMLSILMSSRGEWQQAIQADPIPLDCAIGSTRHLQATCSVLSVALLALCRLGLPVRLSWVRLVPLALPMALSGRVWPLFLTERGVLAPPKPFNPSPLSSCIVPWCSGQSYRPLEPMTSVRIRAGLPLPYPENHYIRLFQSRIRNRDVLSERTAQPHADGQERVRLSVPRPPIAQV